MPDLHVVRFETEEFRYDLALSWDDEALMEGAVILEIAASRSSLSEPGRRTEVTASVSVEQDEERRPVLRVRIGEWTAPPLLLEAIHGDTWLEGLMEHVPAGLIPADPITACLLRSGISTTAGEAIRCNNESKEYAWFRARARAIGRCLRANIVGMGMKMAFRCGRCIARAGF